MNIITRLVIVVFLGFILPKCTTGSFKERVNKKFGDQHFKTAIALIELHKVRFGTYPIIVDSIKYTGDWDKIVWSSVKYEKLDSGYSIDLINGWSGKPNTIEYPDEFWKGLGLINSNMKK